MNHTHSFDNRKQMAKLAAILETAVDAIITITNKGLIDSINPASERLFGYSKDELLGQNVKILMPEPYQSEHDSYLENYFATGIKKIIGIGREVSARRKDGTIFPINLAVSEMVVEGERMFTGIIRDISERKKAEKALLKSEDRFGFLFNTVGTVIFCLSSEHHVLEWNHEAEKSLGWTREEIIAKDFCQACIPSATRNSFSEDLKRVANGEPLLDCERVVVTRSGKERVYLWNLSPFIEDPASDEVKIIACGQDITDYKRVLRELITKKSLAQLGEMAAVVAHEIRNPIAGISGALRIIAGRLPSEEEDLMIINEIIERLANLNQIVNDLLVFARPSAPDCKRVPFNYMLEDSLRLLGEDPAFAHVKVELIGVDCLIYCDPKLLQGVATNILLNAAQAMKGEGCIRVQVVEEAKHWQLSFEDNGPGIPESIQGKLFDPFITTKTRGTGLGLAIAKRVAEQHRGELKVQSSGAGTTFSLILPKP
ncbi:MAG: PAS domain S-box protein [Planctomycetota bacterium]|nr:PAS domain S-box protein [Planctomycetota bacterium]